MLQVHICGEQMLPTTENIKIIEDTIKENFICNNFKGKRIIIFGCTLYATDIIRVLEQCHLEAECFIDNDLTKDGSVCSGIPVRKPGKFLLEYNKEVLVLIASPMYCDEMRAQLIALGLSEHNLLIINVKNPNGSDENVSRTDLDERMEKVQDGISVYEKLKNIKMEIFVFPYPGTGDVYIACGFLNSYLKEKNITTPLLVMTKSNCKQVAELFGFSNFEIISEDSMRNLLLAWQFLGEEKIRIKPLLFWGWDNKYYYRNYKANMKLSFLDFFKYDVYGLNEEELFAHPSISRNDSFVKILFNKLHLKKGKTVIIAPYAGSFVSAIREESWIKIVDMLLKKEYSIVTNCYGNERPIPRTIPIQFPYSEIINVLEYAGNFIGIRSGLCDVGSSAKCNMVIIYESNYLASDYEYFSLKKMGLNNDVIEIEYEDEEQLINELLTLF